MSTKNQKIEFELLKLNLDNVSRETLETKLEELEFIKAYIDSYIMQVESKIYLPF